VVSRDSASGTFESFSELALNKQKVVSSALMQASNQAIATTISKTPGAVGYVGIGYIGDSVKAVSIDGVAASKETVLTGKYPYSRPLFMYTNGEPKGQIKEFMDFVLSADGQNIVSEEGFVSLK
jgi:phosphate transport system substrate-binding protein